MRVGVALVAAAVALATAFGVQLRLEAQGAPVRLVVEAALPELLYTGAEYDFAFALRVDDPEDRVERAVLFLNVVEIDAERTYPQAAHRLFDSVAEEVPVFRVPLEGAWLRAGLSTTVRVRLRRNAPPGAYALVVQLYEGDVTDPHRVRFEDRLAMRGIEFDVVR